MLKYNQVCEPFSSKPLVGNGQTLDVLCVFRKRTPGNPILSGKFRGQRGEGFREGEEGTATLPLSFKPKHLLLWKPRSSMLEQQELSPSVPMQPFWEWLDPRCQLPRCLPEHFLLRERSLAVVVLPAEGAGPAPPRARVTHGRRKGRGGGGGGGRSPGAIPPRAERGPAAPGVGTALVYPRPLLPGATLGGFPLRGAEARFNAAKMN